MAIKFEVRNRWSGEVQFTAEIDCDESAYHSLKLGLAVRWGLKSGANLSGADLSGAVLSRANLSRADLSRADLSGAVLSGADLSGAVLSGADLSGADLSGADLSGADLSRADLSGAVLSGAVLSRAVLSGAVLSGDKIKRLLAIAGRLDGHSFHAFELEAGGMKVKAGCRWFTIPEYRAHIAAEYPGTDKAAETSAILDFFERRARDLGAVQASKAEAA